MEYLHSNIWEWRFWACHLCDLGCQLINGLNLPRPRLPKLRKAQAGGGLALGGEELLHQAFFMLLERLDTLALRPDQIVQRGEAIGDFLLFFG